MIIKELTNERLVIISRAMDSRSKWLYLFYAISFIVVSTIFSVTMLTEYMNAIAAVTILIMIVGFYIAGFRFLNSAMLSQCLLIGPEELQIIHKGFLNTKTQTYKLNEISNLRFLDKGVLSDHALAGNSMDYLGFQTEQKVINEMHGENRIGFDYENGSPVYFGKDLYSWDFEELQKLIGLPQVK